jgi:hypothetical protein
MRHPTTRKQSGSALITALIFLIILTILGLSTMTTSRLEVRMAANTQFAHQAFQAAESGIAQVLADLGENGAGSSLLNTTGGVVSGGSHFFNEDSVNGTFENDGTKYRERATITVEFRPPVGELVEGMSLGANFSAYHFSAVSTGQSSAGGESVHVQGFYIVGPG